MRKFMNRLAIVSLIGLPIAAATAVIPAGASTGVHFRVVSVHSLVTPAKTPNVNIVGNAAKAKFDPTTVKAKEDVSGDNCTGAFISMTLDNTGTKTANVTFGGSPAFSLPGGEGEDLCFYGGAKGDQGTIGLSNAANTKTYASTLTVTLKN